MDLHCGWVGVGGLGLTYLLPAETDGPPLWVGGGWRVGAHLLVTSGDWINLIRSGPPLWVGGGWRVGAHLLVTSGD